MKSLKTFLLLAFCTMAIAGCQSYGKEYKLDSNHNVYYKGEGLDEAVAKKLANYLKDEKYFQDGKEATVQITKSKDTFNLNFVYNKDMVNESIESGFLIFGAGISKTVFGGDPVTIHLCNNKLESFKNIGYCKAKEETPEVTPGPGANNDVPQ